MIVNYPELNSRSKVTVNKLAHVIDHEVLG